MEDNKEKTVTEKSVGKKGILIGVGAIVAALVAFGIYASIGGKRVHTDLEIPENIITESTVRTSDKRLQALSSQINRMYKENAYTTLSVGEDVYLTMIYNKDKQCYAESQFGGSGLYVNPYKCITRTGNEQGEAVFNMTGDITALATAESMLDLAVNGKAIVEDVKLDLLENDTTIATSSNASEANEIMFKIVVMGENIEKIFKPMGEDTAKGMVTSMFGDSVNPNNAMSLLVSINTVDNQMGLGLSMILDETEYINWYFDGSIPLGDWTISKDLETYDYTNLTEDEIKTVGETYDTVIKDISTRIENYMNENKELFDYIEASSNETEEEPTSEESITD